MSATKPTGKLKQTTDEHAPLRQQLIELLHGGQAHATFDDAVKDLPAASAARFLLTSPTPPGSFSSTSASPSATSSTSLRRPPAAISPCVGPQDYWPQSPEPPTDDAWDHSIAAIRSDLETFIALIENPQSDLYKPFRWGEGQNLLREALLIADHNAYHLGELIVLRRLLGAWHK